MAQTYTFTVDNLGSPEAITAQSVCYRVTIYEDAQAGTTDYKVRRPSAASAAVTRPAGAKTVFEAPAGKFFQPGDVIGYAETVTGAVTFAQEEE